ncbi:hypothetical protein [Shewanella sp.]|uniref:hypothetical protein n=1 Tax=Shewanella sp. TaxID=50422 RepID=UPI003A987BEF
MAVGKVLAVFSPVVLALSLTGCGNQVQSQFKAADICKASMATALQKDVNDITVVDRNGQLIYVKYTNKEDWKTDFYRCRVDDNHVVWAPNKGEWQNEKTGIITVSGNRDQLTVTQASDQGDITKQYSLDELRGS